MTPNQTLKPGDLVQLSPQVANPMFACCFMTVSEPKPWGALGYVQALGQRGEMGGQAYYRAKWDEMEFCGAAVWVTGTTTETLAETEVLGPAEDGP